MPPWQQMPPGPQWVQRPVPGYGQEGYSSSMPPPGQVPPPAQIAPDPGWTYNSAPGWTQQEGAAPAEEMPQPDGQIPQDSYQAPKPAFPARGSGREKAVISP